MRSLLELEADYFEKLSLNFGYRISKPTVAAAIAKFVRDPSATSIGGPETFIQSWVRKEIGS